MIATTMTGFTVSGLEQLDKNTAYLFVGNHRDITLDPTFLNYSRYLSGGDTVRIAVGDNLLSKQFISHLIRINKSFIVKRSEKAPRKLFEALKTLSDYIGHSILVDGESVWIAQREGRAKDGMDKTDPTIIKMFAISGRKLDFSDYIHSLKIVPVAISYEYDPCDFLKARELSELAIKGGYKKTPHEDITSIATGISGYKGRVHLSYGKPCSEKFATAEDVAEWLDKEISDLYVLHPTNFFAYYCLFGEYPQCVYSDRHIPFNAENLLAEKARFDAHIDAMPAECRQYALQAYANPVINKLSHIK
jgi:1-acyl-sn-glycerol-3-phosphate acyltransferase